MRALLLTCLLWTGALVLLPAPVGAADSPAASADREIIERLTRMETRLDGLEDSIKQLREAMKGAEPACASPHTLRLRLLCIGDRVRAAVRRIQIGLSSAFPDPHLFRHAWNALAPPAAA